MPFVRAGPSTVTTFTMPLKPSLGTMPQSSALSQLNIYCVALHLLTPSEIIGQSRAQLNLQKKIFSSREDACIVRYHQKKLTGGNLIPQIIGKAAIPRDQTCNPLWWECRYLDNSASLTCCRGCIAGYRYASVLAYRWCTPSTFLPESPRRYRKNWNPCCCFEWVKKRLWILDMHVSVARTSRYQIKKTSIVTFSYVHKYIEGSL